MDVDDFISYLNKLYKKKSKYIQIQKDDIKKLEKLFILEIFNIIKDYYHKKLYWIFKIFLLLYNKNIFFVVNNQF